MKMVIEIPEEEYQTYINHTDAILDASIPLVHQDLLMAVINGKPLDEVLDKIRADIERQEKWLLQAGCTAYNVDIAFDAIKSAVGRGEVE